MSEKILLDALFASEPVRKTIYASGEVDPYPMIRDFISLRLEGESLLSLYPQIVEVAEEGGVLLKGLLDRPLKHESRAGHTHPTAATRWVCLDLDFDEGFDSIPQFLQAIGLGGSGYIFQASARATLESLRGHVFVELTAPALPQQLKLWLKYLNLTIEPLRDRIALAAGGQALRWPLDVTTCQNDKLLFIAPPKFVGMPDPFEEAGESRWLKVEGPPAHVRFSKTSSEIAKLELGVLNALRKEAGLERRRSLPSATGAVPCEEAIVTGYKRARGFVYLNLEGGDSWAYYYPEGNPKIVYNFKGEPNYHLENLAPDLYASEIERVQRESTPPSEDEVAKASTEGARLNHERRFVVRDFRTGRYMAIYVDLDGTTRIGPLRSRSHAVDIVGEMPETIDHWDIQFDPTTMEQIDVSRQWVNEFTPSLYLRQAAPSEGQIPPIIRRVMWSALGSDQAAFDRFLNWLAFIFQTRRKAKTAWILHGETGTGKGLLHAKIITPLLGREYCPEVHLQTMMEQYNAYMRTALCVMIDEIKIDPGRASQVEDKLKMMITEEYPPIRRMYADVQTTERNFANFILATNHGADPVPMAHNDRRYNVAPAQKRKLVITQSEIDAIEEELQEFANFLMAYEVDVEKVTTPLDNEAKRRMIKASSAAYNQLMHAIREGDLAYVASSLDLIGVAIRDVTPSVQTDVLKSMLGAWYESLGRETLVPVGDLATLYQATSGRRLTAAQMMRMLEAHSIDVDFDGVIPVVRVRWTLDHAPDRERAEQQFQQLLRGRTRGVTAAAKLEEKRRNDDEDLGRA